MDEDFTSKILTWAGAYTISFVGLLHLLSSQEHFEAATYLGLAFLANFLGAVVAALGIFWGGYRWAWLLGDVVAGGAFVGFLVSRTIGLPDFPVAVGQWTTPDGLISLVLEGLFVALSLLAITPQGRALVRIEERRIEQERVPPAKQGTPEHFEDIEKEIAEIRSRMAPDLYDLRKHVEPQAIREQVKRSLRKRLHGVLGPVRRRQAEILQSGEEQIRLVREAGKTKSQKL